VYLTNLARFLAKSYEEHIIGLIQHQALTEEDLDYLKIYSSKLNTVSEYFHPAIQAPDDDLIFLARSHPRWQKLLDCIEVVGEADR
jgi:hypothetical protein